MAQLGHHDPRQSRSETSQRVWEVLPLTATIALLELDRCPRVLPAAKLKLKQGFSNVFLLENSILDEKKSVPLYCRVA